MSSSVTGWGKGSEGDPVDGINGTGLMKFALVCHVEVVQSEPND